MAYGYCEIVVTKSHVHNKNEWVAAATCFVVGEKQRENKVYCSVKLLQAVYTVKSFGLL